MKGCASEHRVCQPNYYHDFHDFYHEIFPSIEFHKQYKQNYVHLQKRQI